jgi:ABC-type nickel/cobalt efflux system permease component RcnA
MRVFSVMMVNVLATSMHLQAKEKKLASELESARNHQYENPTGLAKKMPLMGLDEAAKKVKSLPATVTAAMQIKTLHHHKKHRHGDNSACCSRRRRRRRRASKRRSTRPSSRSAT